MINLLKIEWLKIKNYGAFKILAIFFIAGIILSNYIVYISTKSIMENSTGAAIISSFSPYNFPSTWLTTSYTTGCLLILPAMLLIMLVTNEYTFKTNRQNIIDGWSRNEFISVKLFMGLLIAFISTILVFFTAIIFGLISKSTFSFTGVYYLGFFFLKAFSYNSFAILISVLIKRTGFAIGLYFVYMGLENAISKMLDLWSLKIKLDTGKDFGSMGDYLPINAADGLIPFPDNPLKALTKGAFNTDYTWIVLGLALAYLILFLWWSRKKYLNADL